VSFPRVFSALAIGALFGFGLAVAGVLDPRVIRKFLDFFGDFDPRLAFVFAGALGVSTTGYLLSRRLSRPALAEKFALPTTDKIDARLIGGAAVFGVGWGMSGLCPGPAIAGLLLGVPQILMFAAAMAAGMLVFEGVGRMREGATPPLAPPRKEEGNAQRRSEP
jgi:uncharacterized protein